MRLDIFLRGLAVIAFVACGDDAEKKSDTSTTATDATEGDGDDVATTDDATDDTADVPTITCQVGDEQTATMDADGVTLEVCGARLEIPADALAVGTGITLAAIEPPVIAPFERAYIGPVLKVDFGDFDLINENVWRLHVPDVATEGGYRSGAFYVASAESWTGIEICPEEGGVVFEGTASGTFAFFRDTVIFPDSKEGLGDGTLRSTIQGEAEVTWSTDDGYAIHDIDPGGLRAITVAARITSGDQLQQLLIQLSESSDHTFTPLEVSLIDTASTANSYAWLEPVDGPAEAASVLTVGARVVGSFTVEARGEAGTKSITVQIDVSTEHYRHPPDASCFPEG